MEEYPEAELSNRIILAAIEVHRHLGPGLLESAYSACLCRELQLLGLTCEKEKSLPVNYKGIELDCGYRIDLVVEDKIAVELKSVEKMVPIHAAQTPDVHATFKTWSRSSPQLQRSTLEARNKKTRTLIC